MKIGLLLRLFFCVALAGLALYSYIDIQNQVTAQRIRIPQLVQEIKALDEQNVKLRYEIEIFENPLHLLAISHFFGLDYLKHPLLCDVIHLKEGKALYLEPLKQPELFYVKQPRITLGAAKP